MTEEWVKSYIDQLLALGAQLESGSSLQVAVLLRADYAIDLVKAWHDRRPDPSDLPPATARSFVNGDIVQHLWRPDCQNGLPHLIDACGCFAPKPTEFAERSSPSEPKE